MADIPRIHPSDARIKAQRGEALLVCAYEDPESFLNFHLDGAIPLQEFRAMAPALDRGREIVFYCA
jgi:rhodanese-related sulfurtransferase